MIGLALGLALAADPPSCADRALDPVDVPISVAWISPVGRTVRAGAQVEVVPTAALRAWVAAEARGSVGRLLQRVGERGSAREPRRRYKVVVFEAEPGDLCRPIDGHDDPIAVGGLVTCAPRVSGARPGRSGCGTARDRAQGADAFDLYRGRWRDLARNGFCVLPAERFVEAEAAPAE